MFLPNCVVVLPAPELSLKSTVVRAFMLNKLKKNMVLCLKHFGADYQDIVPFAGRLVINSKAPEKILSSLSSCFGINYLSLAQEVQFDSLDDLCAKGIDTAKVRIEKGTFAVRGKSFSKGFSSKKLEEALGRKMLDAFSGLKVKLKGCKHELHCIAGKNNAFFYFEYKDGAKGMPLGSQGRVGLLADNSSNPKDLLSLGKNLMKSGCTVSVVSDSAAPKLELLVEFNCFKPLMHFSIAEAKELYSIGDITAFFSSAKTPSQAEETSELVGVKVFAPLLVE